MSVAVSVLLEALPIDLSQHVDEILKNVLPHFQSTSDIVRQAALNVIQSFSTQCSHTEAIQLMLDKLFQLLNSAPGMEFRMVVLQSIQMLAESKISLYTKQDMQNIVVEKLLKYLKLGLHETTSVCCINALKKWCMLGEESSTVLKVVLGPVVELFNNKSTSVLVRTSLLDFVGDLVMQHHCNEAQVFQVTSLASQSLDRAKAQHSKVSLMQVSSMCKCFSPYVLCICAYVLICILYMQTVIVAEGIAATIMLMKCSERVQLPAVISTKIWNSIETLFVSSKFIAGSQDKELIMLINLGKYVFSNPGYEMPKSLLR